MEIKAADVMKLRKMTGAGMMDCKKALQEAEGDYARAQDIIREKGKLIVAKRADRSATEGVVVTKIVGQKAYLLCLACETDFVAQNAEYAASANAMLEVAVKNDAADRDAAIAPFVETAACCRELGLGVNAGHDLSLENLAFFHRAIPWADEVSIGHALICDALYLGLKETIRSYRACLV